MVTFNGRHTPKPIMKKSAVVEHMQEWFTSTSKSDNDNAATWMPQEF